MLKFYFAPFSRATGLHWLLEEIGKPYEIERVDINAKGGAPESYRKIQPNKKVPAIDHDGVVVTERAAICLYLTEQFPDAKLAPATSDPGRSAFLTWLVYCDSVLDPTIATRALGLKYEASAVSFGSFDDMVANVKGALASRPFIAGGEFTAADTQMASTLYWATDLLKVLPEDKVFRDYIERTCGRPAFQRTIEAEQKYAK
jgi:glutathione S-transferase